MDTPRANQWQMIKRNDDWYLLIPDFWKLPLPVHPSDVPDGLLARADAYPIGKGALDG